MHSTGRGQNPIGVGKKQSIEILWEGSTGSIPAKSECISKRYGHFAGCLKLCK